MFYFYLLFLMEQLKIILEKYQNKHISSKNIFKKIEKEILQKADIFSIKEYIHQEFENNKINKNYINLLNSILILLNKHNNIVKNKKILEYDLENILSKYKFLYYNSNLNNNKNENNNTEINNDNENNNDTETIIEKDVIELEDKEQNQKNEENTALYTKNMQYNSAIINELILKYKDYYNINYNLFNNILQNYFLYSTELLPPSLLESFTEIEYFKLWKKINCKIEIHNNLSKIIYSIHNNHDILFLNEKNILEDEEYINMFFKKLGYIYQKNNKLNKTKLKRGFINVFEKNNENYIVKYQPNKSFIEIIMNIYLKNIDNSHKYICFPEHIIMNYNNSYFYLMKKYECDLFKFFQKNIILSEKNIQKIFYFLTKSIHFLHKNNIIYADLKLENIVVELKDNKISLLKLIDFDVSLFNTLPSSFENFDENIKKIFENKKIRGTKIYMKKTDKMSFENDIYSIGVTMIILLYKNILNVINKEKNNIEESVFNKIKKKIGKYKEKLEDDDIKLDLLNYIIRIYKNRRFEKYWCNNLININELRKIIHKCLNNELTIDIIEKEVKKLSYNNNNES